MLCKWQRKKSDLTDVTDVIALSLRVIAILGEAPRGGILRIALNMQKLMALDGQLNPLFCDDGLMFVFEGKVPVRHCS